MRFPLAVVLLNPGLACVLAACSPTPPGDNPFAPVRIAPAVAVVVPAEDAFEEPEPIKLSSEDMANGTLAVATAAGVDVDALPGEAPVASALLGSVPPAPAGPPAVGLPPDTRWPVRLVSTIPQAQPPRAVLGLPSGLEIVVSPGSMLADQGLVVVAVSAGKVELAQIEPAGDHAKITQITLTAQY
ncbi:MAG: hypothetical protein EXR69_02020 [Myxococcales bacterium]|nr:hypothetical protein [Myxococcales bacterium]